MNKRLEVSPKQLPPPGTLINGEWIDSDNWFDVIDKYSGKPFARAQTATKEMVQNAVKIAKNGMAKGACGTPYQRAQVLRKAAMLLDEKRQQLIPLLALEAGFTHKDASGDIDRACITLNLCAEEAGRLVSEMVPFSADPKGQKRIGYIQHFPIGIVCAITPFNSPLNTVLHKVGPAYAAGNAVILKPSAHTPFTGAFVGVLLLEAGIEPSYLSIVQGDGDTTGKWLLENQDIAFYAFTGSTRVGALIQQAAGLRRTQMELGSVSSTIVCADANLELAVERIANAGFRKAGQVCTSVQRLYIESTCFEPVMSALVDKVKALKVGDPAEPDTIIGPMVTEKAAERAEKWVDAAVDEGARILCGGTRNGSLFQPTLLENVLPSREIWCSEVFAPIVSVSPFTDIDKVFDSVNDTPYGLTVGIFTNTLDLAFRATQELRFGTVLVNETSSARSDVMPYGGVKASGFGKEGPHYAIREMTEQRLVIFNNQA